VPDHTDLNYHIDPKFLGAKQHSEINLSTIFLCSSGLQYFKMHLGTHHRIQACSLKIHSIASEYQMEAKLLNNH
jgi:hypothetical protein